MLVHSGSVVENIPLPSSILPTGTGQFVLPDNIGASSSSFSFLSLLK